MRTLIFLLVTSSVFLFNPLNAEPPFDFGRISASEMDLEYFREKYPGEPAVIIGDFADCRFNYDDHKGFQFVIRRHYRIIILNEAGLDYGNFSIPYYKTPETEEVIRRFRAHVYNKDGNRINRTRIRDREGFTNERGNNWKELTFAFPEVRVGSVIEVRYDLISDFLFQLRSWRFQYEIPVIHSEYQINLPSFYVYYASLRGFIDLDVREEKSAIDSWQIRRKINTAYGQVDGGLINVTARSTQFRWVAKNVPAMKPEPHTDNIRNYMSTMFFEFAHEQWPDEEPKHFTTTWEDIMNYLDDHEYFGKYLKESYLALYQFLPEQNPEQPEEIIWYALETIHDNVRWNNDESFLTDDSPKEVLEKGIGNSAEINLLLVAMLKNMGVEAYPVAVSTVSNGALQSDRPTLIQWNYLVALARLPDDNFILLDATVPRPIPGFLPQRAINGRGRAFDPNFNNWVNLETKIQINQENIYNLRINENGDLTGNLEFKINNFGKYRLIQQFAIQDEERFWNALIGGADVTFTNQNIAYNHKDEKPMIITADIHIPSYGMLIGDELILPALFFETLEENVFQAEERLYPVFFDNTVNNVTRINLELPENMSISYLPEARNRRWGRLSYTLMANETDNGLQITWTNNRLMRIIQPDSYAGFRRFYSHMIEDNLENIILKVE